MQIVASEPRKSAQIVREIVATMLIASADGKISASAIEFKPKVMHTPRQSYIVAPSTISVFSLNPFLIE